MEHRCSRRIPLNINTLIYKYGVPVAMGRIKNGSGHGLYLETDYREVRELQKLELEVLLGQRPKGKEGRAGGGRYQISALVVRKSDFGYGLEMEILNDSGSQQLSEYIQQQKALPVDSGSPSETPSQALVAGPAEVLPNYKVHKRGPYFSPRG